MAVVSLISVLLGSATVLTAQEVSDPSVLSQTSVVESADSIPVAEVLDELVITAPQNIISSDGGSVTYNLDNDDSVKGQSLLDALKKVPMISVDGQDKIYINGDSNFKIYVNGKEEPMLEGNASTIFKAMPADAVAKIEVVIEPGANYDAEGSGGILKLTTERKQRDDGYSGSVSASVSNNDYSGSIFARMKYSRISADANVNYSSSLAGQENLQDYSVTDLTNPENYRQEISQNQKIGFRFVNASLNMSYEHDDNNLFSLGASVMNMDGRIKSLFARTGMYDSSSRLLWSYDRNLWGTIKMLSATGNASYQHNFGNTGHRIIAAYLFNFGSNPLDVTSHSESGYNYEPTIPYMGNLNENYTREHTFQLDYANPFNGDKHKLEAGAKVILRHNSAFGSTLYGIFPDAMTADDKSDVNLRQNQNIYAAYTSYTGHFGNWGAVAGLRYEHTMMEMDYRNDNGSDFTKHLNDFVPNAAVTYSLSPMSNLRLSYQMRIRRPSLQQLNPYQMDIFQTIVQEGNPNLESEKSNEFAFTFSKFGRIVGGNVSVRYKFTDNAIEQLSYNEGTVLHVTNANIGNVSEYSADGFMNVNITQKMSLTLNGRIAYVHMRARIYRNHGWTGNYGVNWNYTGPADIKFSVYGGQNINQITLQGSMSGWYYYGLGISRDFLKDKSLNIALNASNFLAKYSVFKSHSRTETSYSENSFHNRSWRVGISATWSFGNLKSQSRKVELNISNDDLSSPQGKTGAGISL